jgi:hypothetical protein
MVEEFEKQFITKFSKTIDKNIKIGYNKQCRVLRLLREGEMA